MYAVDYVICAGVQGYATNIADFFSSAVSIQDLFSLHELCSEPFSPFMMLSL